MSNGFQLLCSTTTVWIIDTLFQLVSSGLKIFFISQVMNYLLPVSCYAFKQGLPGLPGRPGLQEAGKAGHCCV